MILNLNTLLSTFNEKGTLLKWLVKLENALNTSTLTNVEAVNQTPTSFALKFTFADNTTVTSEPIPIEKGLDGTNGADGVSIQSVTAGTPIIEGDKTKTPITVTLTVGAPQSFTVEAQNGARGADGTNGVNGVGITSVTAGTPVVEADKTKTPVTVNLTAGAPQSFTVEAQNGARGADGTNGVNGADGVGVEAIENNGYSYSDQYTISHITVTLSNGQVESFDVQALNNTAYQELIIEAPEGATSGTLTTEQLTGLQRNPNKVIVLAGETYRLADDMTTAGYLVYSHVGHNTANTVFLKFFTITISTLGWVFTSKIVTTQKLYCHTVTVTTQNTASTSNQVKFQLTLFDGTGNRYSSISALSTALNRNVPAVRGSVMNSSNIILPVYGVSGSAGSLEVQTGSTSTATLTQSTPQLVSVADVVRNVLVSQL